MAGSKISTTITTPVTLGSAAYPTPLTITDRGAILSDIGGNGIILPNGSSGTIINHGIILTKGFDGYPGTATGVYAADANVVIRNTGEISAFVGVNLATGSLTNSGYIMGGYGNTFGVGVISGDARITNSGIINGSYGDGIIINGATSLQNLAGGEIYGILISNQGNVSIVNHGMIIAPNEGYSDYRAYAILVGGVPGDTIINTGTIEGEIFSDASATGVVIVNSGEIISDPKVFNAAGIDLYGGGNPNEFRHHLRRQCRGGAVHRQGDKFRLYVRPVPGRQQRG